MGNTFIICMHNEIYVYKTMSVYMTQLISTTVAWNIHTVEFFSVFAWSSSIFIVGDVVVGLNYVYVIFIFAWNGRSYVSIFGIAHLLSPFSLSFFCFPFSFCLYTAKCFMEQMKRIKLMNKYAMVKVVHVAMKNEIT